jgi:hypothetical protein
MCAALSVFGESVKVPSLNAYTDKLHSARKRLSKVAVGLDRINGRLEDIRSLVRRKEFGSGRPISQHSAQHSHHPIVSPHANAINNDAAPMRAHTPSAASSAAASSAVGSSAGGSAAATPPIPTANASAAGAAAAAASDSKLTFDAKSAPQQTSAPIAVQPAGGGGGGGGSGGVAAGGNASAPSSLAPGSVTVPFKDASSKHVTSISDLLDWS